MSEPLFSIIIACYNHERFVRDAVQSALGQPHPSKEIIVVDDASRDGTAAIVSSFGDSVIFERLSVNGGASAARNHGASVARGKYLVFLDGDDALMPWSLAVYGRIIAERNPAIILGRSSLFSGDLPTITTEPPANIRFVAYAGFLDKDRPWVYNSSSLLVQRAAFREAGGWSADIFYQDIQDLLNKLCVAGETSLILAPETVLYRMHSTNAVRQVAPFIEGVYRLLAKDRKGAYPGGPKIRAKRAAWFGGLIFYWARAGMRNGPFLRGLALGVAQSWRILLAVLRRAVALITGRAPVQVLTMEPNGSETAGSHLVYSTRREQSSMKAGVTDARSASRPGEKACKSES